MKTLATRIARWVAGSFLILAGLLLSVPGVPGPGLIIVLLGLLVLLPESRWLRRQYIRCKLKYPWVVGFIEARRARRRVRLRGSRRSPASQP
jgi:hypothetical protein